MRAAIQHFFSRKNQFLRNMLLSIVGLVCLPLIVIQLWIIHQTTSEYQSSNASAYVSALQANANTYNMQLQLLSETAIHMTQDAALQAPLRDQARDRVWLQLQTINQIKSYLTTTPFVADIAIYYRPNDYLLSSNCKQTLENFCVGIAGSDAPAAAQLYGFLDTVTTDTYSARFDDSGYLIFARPVSLISVKKQDAVICFLIRSATFNQTYESSLPYGAGFTILNSNREVVLCSNSFPAELLDGETVNAFLDDPASSTLPVEIRDKQQYLYKYTDPDTGYIYMASAGGDAVEQTLVRYVSRLHATLIVSLLFMCILLGITVYINYRPVKKLLTRHLPEKGGTDLSELELLDSLFFAKDERITSQNNLLASFLISDLLFGVDVDPELLRTHFPEDTYRHFAVAAVSQVQLSPAQTNSAAALLRGSIGSTEFCTTRLPNSPRTLFIFMSGTPLNRGLLKDKLQFTVSKLTSSECSVTLGVTVSRIGELPASHQSALAGSASLPPQEVLPNENPWITKEIRTFIQQLVSGNREQALSALENAESLLADSSVGENYRNYCCYKLLSAYLTAVSENQVALPEGESEALLAFRSPVQLFALLRQSAASYCSRVRTVGSPANDQQQEKLRQYVNDNLTNSELCMSSAAEYMSLSIYAVSRLFKEATHMNFKEYITLGRLKMAHDLLLSTDQTISEIATAVGFEDASYFSEVFKKHYHAVPTKVRTAARQSDQ